MFYFIAVSWEWDAIHLYIVDNLDWMMVWIEWCKQSNNGKLSWYDVSTLVKETECRGDTNITNREIELAYGLKDAQASIFTHTT